MSVRSLRTLLFAVLCVPVLAGLASAQFAFIAPSIRPEAGAPALIQPLAFPLRPVR